MSETKMPKKYLLEGSLPTSDAYMAPLVGHQAERWQDLSEKNSLELQQSARILGKAITNVSFVKKPSSERYRTSTTKDNASLVPGRMNTVNIVDAEISTKLSDYSRVYSYASNYYRQLGATAQPDTFDLAYVARILEQSYYATNEQAKNKNKSKHLPLEARSLELEMKWDIIVNLTDAEKLIHADDQKRELVLDELDSLRNTYGSILEEVHSSHEHTNQAKSQKLMLLEARILDIEELQLIVNQQSDKLKSPPIDNDYDKEWREHIAKRATLVEKYQHEIETGILYEQYLIMQYLVYAYDNEIIGQVFARHVLSREDQPSDLLLKNKLPRLAFDVSVDYFSIEDNLPTKRNITRTQAKAVRNKSVIDTIHPIINTQFLALENISNEYLSSEAGDIRQRFDDF